MNIAEVLHDQAVRRGAQLAIVDGRRSVTFAELNDEAARAAADLAAAGLRASARALVFCPMSIELYVTLIGMFRIGVVAVFLDPSAGRHQISACCDRLQPRGFVAVPRAHLLRLISRSIWRVPVKVAIGGGVPGTRTVAMPGARSGRSRLQSIQPCEPDSAALVTFTSGTTGRPKAVVRTHGFLLAQHHVLAEELELREGEVDLTTLPIFVLANLASGVTSVIPDADLRAPAAVDPVPLLRQIRMTRAMRTAASPALLQRLARHLESSGERVDIARIFSGGAPVFPVVLDALAAVAPGASITAVYGSSEAEPIARVDRSDIAEADRARIRTGAGLLAGVPVSSIDLRVIPDEWGTPLGPYDPETFEAHALPIGGHGEVVVAGAHVLTGYLDGHGDEETKIRVGVRVWHRTGDAGYIDPVGRLWLLGRCSARVTDAHGTLYPFAVECAASDVSGVQRTAFAQHRGRRILLAEVHAPTRASTVNELRQRLEWAHLDDVIVVDQIPVDSRHNAKVDYPALERLLNERG